MSIVFIDNSGSVCGNSFYWNEVSNILKKYNDIKEYYLWNDKIHLISNEKIYDVIQGKAGDRGTSISIIANEIIKKAYNKEQIIIITDGMVNDGEVKKTEDYLSNFHISNVECYILNDIHINDIDVSVPLAFMRNCNAKLYFSNIQYSLKLMKDINLDDYKLLDDINVDNLIDNYDKIYDLLNLKNMNKNGLPIIKERLLNIRADFIKIGNAKLSKEDGFIIQDYLMNKDYTNAISLMKKVEEDFILNNPKNDFTSKFDRLLALCDDRTNSGYSLMMKMNKAKTAEEIIPEEDIKLDNYSFEDPILLEIDVPQLLLLDDDELLFNDDKLFKQLIENPLSILHNVELKNKIANRIGHCIGVKISNKINYDPYNRRKIIGTIPLTIDNDQHLKVGNYGLYKLFTNGKMMGNVNLFYIILWKIINENQCNYLNDYMNEINNHLLYRLRNSKTYISMQGLPEYNRTIVPLDVAFYYVINSRNINLNILKMHLFNTDVIMDILINILKYEIDEATMKYISLLKVALSMQKMANMNKKDFENKINCLLNSYIVINNIYVPYDIEINNDEYENLLKEFPVYYSKLDRNELIYIAKSILEMKNIDLIIPDDVMINDKYEFERTWDMNYRVNKSNPLKISLKTFRPYYVENWKELATNYLDTDINKQISGYNDYIRCYLRNHEFPNYETYVSYIYHRYKKPVHQDISNIYNEVKIAYNEVRNYINENNLDYQQIKAILLNSCKIANRIEIQNKDIK
jgi:hypothetical protein